jgi:hypothetical protein
MPEHGPPCAGLLSNAYATRAAHRGSAARQWAVCIAEQRRRMSKIKHVLLEAFLPEMKGRADFVAHGEAGSVKPAISRAFGNLLKQVKAKRVSTIKATLVITTKDTEAGQCDTPITTE